MHCRVRDRAAMVTPMPSTDRTVFLTPSAGRAVAAATAIAPSASPSIAVAGLAVGLTGDLKVGDVVVATQVSDATDPAGPLTLSCPSAPLLAGDLRRAGLTVHVGPVATVSSQAGAR